MPLGPGEVYHPWFRASPTYVRNVNIRQVTNVANITNVNNVSDQQFPQCAFRGGSAGGSDGDVAADPGRGACG